MIMSIIYPDEGRISVMGGSAPDRKDDIGYLPGGASTGRCGWSSCSGMWRG